ncbi:MAG: HD domain-containing phosphohydrolase [Ornithinimicrobium sp.]
MSAPREGRARWGSSLVFSRTTISVAVLNVLALLLAVVGLWDQDSISTVTVLTLWLLGVLGVNLRERELGDQLGVSFTTVVLAAAIVLTGHGAAVLIGYFSFMADFRDRRVTPRLFNAAMTGCMAAGGSWMYEFSKGYQPIPDDITPTEILMYVALPLLAAYLVSIAINALLVALMKRITMGVPVIQSVLGVLGSLGLGYVMHVLVALLFVVLWEPVGMGPFSAVLIIVPLLLTHWALIRNARERRSHSRTVSTLMAALEVASPYSNGHSSRVAELADRMAGRLGITGEAADSLHFAALLHDLGMVSTAPRVPRLTTPDDVSYLAAIQEHPEAGVQMLTNIDFLAPAIPGILHHHERFDGLGYPAGLAAEDIPLFARIIAVADAFDSLTTSRSYRSAMSADEALRQLWDRAGTHLDPSIVLTLTQALSDDPWASTQIPEDVLATAVDVNDHDDPDVSDAYAAWQPESDEVHL